MRKLMVSVVACVALLNINCAHKEGKDGKGCCAGKDKAHQCAEKSCPHKHAAHEAGQKAEGSTEAKHNCEGCKDGACDAKKKPQG